MNNCLILLTNYYPFHKGEEYLESEIEHLAANFQKIFVIPTMVSSDLKKTRTVPKNVTILPVGIKHSILGKASMVTRQLRNILKDSQKRQMIKDDSNGKILPLMYCHYFESRAMDIYDRTIKLLDKYNFNKYDSITIYSYWFYITARLGVELKNKYFKNRNLYLLTRAHGYDINEHVNPLKYLPEREYLLKHLDNVFPVSQNGVDFLKSKYTKYKNKIEVRRLGTKSLKIKKQNNNNKMLYIVSCSTVRKLKRIDLIIDALTVLQKENIQFKWTHIGNGPDFEHIKKLAKQKLNSENFNFTGYMSNNNVLQWYMNNPTTVFVNTSISEGVPVSIMEAMSMSIPIIATDVGGTSEIVKNEENGFLLNKNCTVDDIVRCLLLIYRMSTVEYGKMCEKSYQIWNEKSNAEKLYSNFAYELLIKGIEKKQDII